MASILPQDFRAPFFRRPWRRVLNGSGEVIPPHSVVLIGDTTVVNGELVHTVIKPNNSSTEFNFAGYLVTWQFEIGAKSTDEGMADDLSMSGLVRCNGSPTKGTIWGPKHGQFTLEQYRYGFLIEATGTTTSSGQTVCVAKWVGIPSVLGKTDSISNKGSASVTVSVWAGPYGSEANTDMDIPNVGNNFASVDSGKWVWVSLNGGSPYITQTEKTQVTPLTNIRMKSGNAWVEAESLATFVDTVATAAYSDKIELGDC